MLKIKFFFLIAEVQEKTKKNTKDE